MSLSRRRFLTISAAFATAPNVAQAQTTWNGRAFGGDVSMTLRGPRAEVADAMAQARGMIHEIESLFTLFDPASALSRLNAEGQLRDPHPHFVSLMREAEYVYRLTGGLFDPTVQNLWRAAANGSTLSDASDTVGWDRVSVAPDLIVLGQGQALTFNGIAQGYATDQVSELLQRLGLSQVLVNIGEHRGLGGPWKLGLSDPQQGYLGQRTLTNSAIATSSAMAMTLPSAKSHILHSTAQPKWSTVSVEARAATLADGLSTALTLATRSQIGTIKEAEPKVARITLVDFDGELTTL